MKFKNMKTINQQLDKLFREWKLRYPNSEELKKFVSDGLMYKYNPKWEILEEENTLSGSEADISVEGLWRKAPIRVAFILKDKSDGTGDDVRQWMLLKNENGDKNRNLRSKIMKNLAGLLYGLTVKQVGYAQLDFETLKRTWETIPFAYIEAKKIAGEPDVDKSEMQKALKEDGDLLLREIDFLDPNVLVCFDAEDTQYNYITQEYDKLCTEDEIITISKQYDLPPHFSCCLRYYKPLNMVVIKSYHPTYRNGDWKVYEKVISPYREFNNRCPEFFEQK